LLNNFVDPRALPLDSIVRFGHYGGAGRDVLILGAVARRGNLCRVSGYLSSQTQNWMWLLGLFFVLVVLFFPRGVLGAIRRKAAI
jgi:branched-chain amino acid transport system permease protein